MRILCVHGVGRVEADSAFPDSWFQVIRDFPLGVPTILKALKELTKSAARSAWDDLTGSIGDLFGSRRMP
jgi:hypothetical protein